MHVRARAAVRGYRTMDGAQRVTHAAMRPNVPCAGAESETGFDLT